MKSCANEVGLASMLSQSRKRLFASCDALWRKLDDYQQKAVEFSKRVKTSALLFEQGTGKTWIAGGIAASLIRDYVDYPFCGLFIVPLTNIDTTWAKFFHEQLPDVHLCRSLEEYVAAGAKVPRVLLLHYEALPEVVKKISKGLQWTLIVVDESQRLKNRNTLQSKTVAKLKGSAPYKVILTGTPIEDSPSDLWAQFRFVRPELFGTKWKDFEDYYMTPLEDFDFKKYPRGSMRYMRAFKKYMIQKSHREFDPEKIDEFIGQVSPYCMRVTKEDVLDLSPITFIEELVGLLGYQRQTYLEMQRDLIVRLKGDAASSAPLSITKIGKLHQICGGHLFDDDGAVHFIGRAKLRRLITIIKRHADEPIVVFCRYLEEVRMLERELSERGYSVATLSGQVKKKHRAAIIDQFQTGKTDVLIAQVRTGGVGIDLFASRIEIFYSTTYSYIDFEQAVSRVHRRGQEKDVIVYLITAIGTIDEVIYSAIRSKRRVSKRVLTNLIGEYLWRKKKQSRHTMLSASQRTSASNRHRSASPFERMTSRSQASPTSGKVRRHTMKS